MVGQPMHAAAIAFDKAPDGHWEMDKYNWIYSSYWTTFENPIQTDDISGPIKTRETSIDHAASIPLAMNVGLDSYVDVRLAMHLFKVCITTRATLFYPALLIFFECTRDESTRSRSLGTDFYASGYDDFAK